MPSAPTVNVVRISNKCGHTAGVATLVKRLPHVLISALSVKANEIQKDASKRMDENNQLRPQCSDLSQ